MHFTNQEKAVIDCLHKWRVSTRKNLCGFIKISHMTVVRALKKHGYYTSYNKNSAYYTLKDIPTFDANGLWSHQDIHFSRHGTLVETMLSLVEQSSSGYTVHEMEKLLRTKAGNLLCLLCREKRLSRYYTGHYAVYLSTDSSVQAKQKSQRQQQVEETRIATELVPTPKKELPEDIDIMTVVNVLIKMIELPKASVASLSRSLRHQDIGTTADEIRKIIKFYSLKKKRHSEHS